MIGLVRSVLGLVGGKWLLGGSLAIILALSGWLLVEKWQHSGTKADLVAMTSLRNEERNNHRQTKANFTAAMRQARIDRDNAVLIREAQWRKQSNEMEQSIKSELGRALVLADARIERLRQRPEARTSVASGASRNEVASAAAAPAELGRSSGMPVMDETDLRICTINTVEYRQIKALYEGMRAGSMKPTVP